MLATIFLALCDRTFIILWLNDALTQPLHVYAVSLSALIQEKTAGLTTRDDDDEQKHDYAHDDPDPHLHVLPPHLLADSVGATTEALGGLVEIFGFVLELVDMLAALGYGFKVLFHDVDGVVDLLLMQSGVSVCAL